jgi:hypothetical protein
LNNFPARHIYKTRQILVNSEKSGSDFLQNKLEIT